ncbi:PAS domain S-box protein [candidate division KSB3 bacterium]|uniref:histidine kinase n=1 Tax=candidate division KSB3 bacterium TaxID=2044937 RepID=A0A9D5JWN5_9BACT|nr:PAS domain S-box protein [candidate division KSB3 bacterium]MBD3325503.1 PAS domain S-box protein [candidate division KSB3 bacterium]
MKPWNSITQTLLYSMVTITVITLSIVGYFWIAGEYHEFREEAAAIREEFFEGQKTLIKHETERVVDYIEFKQSQAEARLRQTIKSRAKEAHAIAMNLYQKHHPHDDPSEVQQIIIDALRPIRFHQGRGYYFITRLDGLEILFADRPEMEGVNLIEMQDTQGKFVIRDMIEIIKTSGAGFYRYTWTKPQEEGKDFPKIAYIIHFDPFDWLIGTGEYLDDVVKDIQTEVLERIESITFGDEGYIFAGQWDGLSLLEPAKGQNMIDVTDMNGVKIVQKLIRAAKSGGGYVSYVMPNFDEEGNYHKLSYAVGIPEWKWYVGAGVNIDEIETTINQKRAALHQMVKSHILNIVGILLSVFLLILLLVKFFSGRIRKSLELFTTFFEKAATESVRIDQTEVHFGEFQHLATAVNQMVEERVNTEQALRESEARYRSVVEDQTEFIVRWLPDGTRTFVNDVYCRYFDQPREALIGTSFFPLITEEDRDRVRRKIASATPENPILTDEHRSIRPDGTLAWQQWTDRALFDPDGRLLEFQSVGRDISERKQAELQLRKERDRSQQYLDIAGVMFVALDPEQRVTLINKKGCEILGYDEQEILGINWFEHFLPPVNIADVKAVFEQIMSGDIAPVEYYENPVLTKERSTRLIAWHNSVVRDESGKITGLLSSGEDITYRRQAEEELMHLRNLLSNIINSMPSILVGVDPDARVIQWNREAEKMTGVTADQARGQTLTEVFPQMATELQNIREALRSHEPQTHEKVAHQCNGEMRFCDITVYPLITNGIDGAVIRIDDVTDRVHIEEMMIQTEKMMTVGGLAAGMAHEINNPLGIILQSIQNTQRRLSPELAINWKIAEESGTHLEHIQRYLEKRHIFKYLQGMQDAGLRASKIVKNMLNFSRRSESAMAPTDINQLLEETIELAVHDYDLRKKYDFRHIDIQRDYDATLPPVPCTATEIEQVFLNLLRNAAQAIAEHKGGAYTPQIRIQTTHNHEQAIIHIEDNGPGMDEATRKRIFEPFFTTKVVGTGTGLGLSVSYFIVVTNHHGTISVDSSPAQGSRFTICLPLSRKREKQHQMG